MEIEADNLDLSDKFCLELADAVATTQFGELLAALVTGHTVIALNGPLGAGKTTFVQGLAKGLGVKEVVNSPTFTMLNEYHSGRLALYHYDFYRLKGDAQTEAAYSGESLLDFLIEFEEILDSDSVVVMEWSTCLEEHLPADMLTINLSYHENADGQDLMDSMPEAAWGRIATIECRGGKALKILRLLQSESNIC